MWSGEVSKAFRNRAYQKDPLFKVKSVELEKVSRSREMECFTSVTVKVVMRSFMFGWGKDDLNISKVEPTVMPWSKGLFGCPDSWAQIVAVLGNPTWIRLSSTFLRSSCVFLGLKLVARAYLLLYFISISMIFISNCICCSLLPAELNPSFTKSPAVHRDFQSSGTNSSCFVKLDAERSRKEHISSD